MMLRVAGWIVMLALSAACGTRADQPPQPAESKIVWHTLGSWSGRGNRQTESFTSDTGTLRVTWEATGDFSLTAHSAISGRTLQQVVDHDRSGRGVGYVQQDPHVFYMVVEAGKVDWKFTVEEAIGYP